MPRSSSDHVSVFFDAAFPDYGAIAVYRQMHLPDAIAPEDIALSAAENYGEAGRVTDHLIWVDNGDAWAAASYNPDADAEPKIML